MKAIKFLLALSLIALTWSCTGNNEGSVERVFFENKALNLNANDPDVPFVIASGNNVVFRYTLNHPEDSKVEDDEISDLFLFEIPSNETNFNYDLVNNANVPVAYQRVCFCAPTIFTVISARIAGNKTNQGEWRIIFEAQARDNEGLIYPITDEGNYRLSTN